jgi:hypothetical protein
MKYSIAKLTPTSNKNINYIFENYESKLKFEIKDTYFIKLLYTLLDRASDTIIEHTTITDNKPIKNINTPFMSPEILNYINTNDFIHHSIQFKIKDATYNVNIYTQKEIQLNKYIYFIKLILIMCSQHATTRYNVYTFKIILTDFKKEQPVMPVEANVINSGVTSFPLKESQDSHKEIVIFRKEEWFKVFIHECFHLFCLDFAGSDKDYAKLFKPLFNIESDFLFFESLCEFWSRTLNIAVISYSTKKNIMYEEFEELMKINIQIEKIYSLLQMKHILSNMGFTYESLMDKKRELTFKENTNLFCYYVLTPVLLFHYEQTMSWFVEHNQTLLQFTKDKKSILLFFHYIKSIYKHTPLLQMIDSLESYKLTNNYMSVFEIQI